MPIYRANGNRYNIPDDKIQDFERRYPESKVEMYDGEGKKYAIPLSKRNKFQQRYEKWSYVTEETKKKSPNTFISNQNPQNTIVSEDELENSIANYEESFGHGKYGAGNTPLFQKVRQAATSAEQIADGIIDKNWISQSPSSSARDSEIGEVSVGRRGSTSTRTPVSDAYKSQFDKPLEDRFADARTRLEKDVVFQFENMLNKIEEDINENSEWRRGKAEQIENEGDIFKGYEGYKNITEDTIEDLEREGYVPKEMGEILKRRSVQNLTRKYISEARDVIEMYKRKDGNGLANFADAFARSFDSGILTLGATDAIDMGRVLAIANKIGDNGEGFEKLTKEEQQLMAAFSLLDQIQGSLQLDTWQNIGQGTMQSLPFLAQFALTGGVGAAASAATKAAAKTAVKKIIGRSASKAVSRIAANAGKNAAGRVAVKAASKLGNAAIDGLVGGAVMALTSGAAHTVEDVMSRMVGDHDIRLGSINDPSGELKTIYTHHGVEDRESLGLAFLKGFAANLIENGTEYMGNYMGLNLGKLLSRYKGGRQLLTKPLIGKSTRFARQVGKLTGFNGFIPEVAEEELGMLLNAATVGDVEWEDIKDPEQQFQTVMAVGIMSLGFQVANSIGVGLTYNQYRKAKKRYESKDLGEGLSVDDIIHGLDNVPLDRRADYVMATVNTHDLGKEDAKDLQDFVMARTGYEFILGKIESDAEEAGDKAAEAEMRLINKEMGGKVTVTLLDGREAILTVGNVSLEPNAAGEYTSTTQSGSLIAVPVGIGNTPIMVSPKDIRSVSIMSTEDAVGQARAMAEDITKTNMASQIENEADEVESDEQSRTPSSTMSGGEIGELSPRDEGVEKQPLYRKSELEIGDVVTFNDYSDPENPGVERTLKIIGIDDSGVDVEDVVDGVPLPLSIKPEQITNVKGREKNQTADKESGQQTTLQTEAADTSEYTRFVEDGTVEDSTVLRIANKIANGEQLTREEEAMRQEVSQRVEDKLREIQQNVEGKEETDRWAKYRKSNGEVDEKKMPLQEQFEYGEEIAGVKAMIEVAKAGTKKTQSEIARLEKEIEREISPIKRVNKEKQLKSLNERLGIYQQYLKDKEPLPYDLAPRNDIAFRRDELGETQSGQTQINERESNSNKENSLSSQEEKQIDSQDEILQSIPQRERGTEAQKDRRMEEAERAIRRSQGSGTNETQFGGSQSALSRQEIEARAAEEYDPVGEGPFGEIYAQFKGKPREAIDFLMKKKSGEAIGALYHKDVGDIDLVWGKEGTGHSDGFGLAKLVKYHPEVLDNLQDILNDMQVTTRNSNRINLESTTHRATIRLEWDGNKKNWLLTAFEKENPASTKTTDTDTTSLRGGTALSQAGFSAGKDNTSASNEQEKNRLSTQKTPQERRREIREYIGREAGKLNIPVRVVEDVSQISPSEKNYTKKLKSLGWYDKDTGEIVIVAPNHGSIRNAQRTLLHEAVAHYGLPSMLGRENFDKLCDQVWDSMTDNERATFAAYLDDKSYDSLTNEEKEQYTANDFSGKRAAADEYLAHFAEEGITNPSLWSKIKRFIKEAFRKIGIDLSLTDSDIAYLLWKSKNRITDRDSTNDIIRKSAADTRIKENIGSTRFRINTPVEQRGDLVAIHNISEDKLKEAISLGGFPMPSIAITKPEVGHSTFGDISLVFGKETINPTDRRNKVYGEDAWTPTFPTVGYKLNEDKTSDIYRRANKAGNLPLFNPVGFHSDNYKSYINGIGSDSLVNHFKDSYGAKQLYLAETGNAVEKFEMHEVEKYSEERIGFLEKVLKEIGIERLKKESYAVLENEIKQILGKYYNVDFDKLKPSIARIRIDNAIKQAVDYAENGNSKTESDVEATKKKIDDRIDQKKFEEWLRNLFNGVVEKKGIRNETDLFTPIGNRRKWESLYDEITLDNVVKAMKKQSAKGGQGLFGGSIFGAAQSEFKNIDEIREAARERIRELSNEEIEGRRNEITDRLSQIDIPMRDKGIGDSFDMIENITDSVRHSHTAKGIYNYLHDIYPGMTMDIANEIADIVKDIQQMSARYFEAKPYRAVGFDEIKFAVVPDNTDVSLLNQLQSMKIPVETYEKGNNEQRKQVLNESSDKYDTRFRIGEAYTSEEQDIIERARENGTYMKAPNGADTNLTPKQWAQVRTRSFKDWFGDWEDSLKTASKVVDENGEPKVVFHGTPLRRDQITPNRGWQKDGITYISQEAPFYAFRGGEYSGMIFTSVDPEKARSIAEKRAMSIPDDMDGTEQWTEEGYVYDLFVDVKKPFVPQRDADIVLSSLGDEIPTLSFYGGQGDTVSVETAKEILNSGNSWLVTETPQFVAEIKKLGYDGLTGTDEGVDYIACFNPNQLKDAYDNTGTFSTENDDIRFRTIVVNPRYGSKIETVRTNHTSVYKAVDKYLRENFDEKDYTTHTAKTGSRYLELNIGGDTLKVRFANHTPRMEASDNMDTIGNGKEIAFFPGGDIEVEIDISLNGDRSKEIIDLIKGMKEYSSSEVKKEVSRLIDGAKTDPFPDVASPQLIEELSHYIGTEMASTLDTQIAESYKYRVNENVYKQESKSRDSKLKQNKYVLEQYKTIFRDFVQESPKLIKAVGGGYWYNGATGSIRIVPPFPIDYGLLSNKLMSSHFIPLSGINKKEGKRQIVQEYVDEWSRRLTDSGIFLSEEYVSEGAKITEAQQEIDNIREQYNFWVKAKLNTEANAADTDTRYRISETEAEYMEAVNQRFNEQLSELTEENADRIIMSLGRPSEILRSVDMPDRDIRLYGNKVMKKSKSHEYSPHDLKDLPKMIQHPIAIFKGSYPGSFSLLTEIELNGNNALVSIDIKKGEVQDINLVTSVYGKKGDNVLSWIEEGKMLYTDKKKTLDYISSSAPIADATYNQGGNKALDYLYYPAPIAETPSSQELSTATNIVENFENPKLAGENSDGTMNTRFRREAPDVSSYIKISMDGNGIVDLSQLPPEQSQRIRKSAPAAYGAEISSDIASFPDYQEAENCLTYIFNNNDIIADNIRNSIDNGTLPQEIAMIFDAALRRGMARRVWIDRYQPLEALQNLISSTLGKEISEKENAWEYTGFIDSRIKAEADEYNADYYLPLLELYEKIIHGKNGIDEDTLVDYMLIKHGIERNQVMRREALEEWEESHKGVEDYDKKRAGYIQELSTRDYSGYFDRFKQEYAQNYNTAEDFISEVESLLSENTVISLWDKIKKATNKTLDISVQSGLVSKEDADTYKKRFQFYVPLRGFSEETMDQMYDSNIRINLGSTVNKQAKGRTSRADNPLVSIMAMANTEIARANKNKMKQRLLTLLAGKDVRNKFGYSYEVEYKDGKKKILKYKPKPSDEIKKITTISNIYQLIPKYEIIALDTNGNPILDEHGNKTWVETDEVPSAEQLESGTARFSKAYPSNRGTVHKTPSQMDESTVDVFVAGKKVSILFTNPLVSNSINGRLNLDKNAPRKIETPDHWYNVPGWLTYGARHLNRLGAGTTRALSQFYTTYSPAFFLFSNFARDFSGAFAYNSAEKSFSEARQIAALAPDSFAAMRRYIWGESKNKRYTMEEIDSFLDRMGRKGKISKPDYDIAAYLFVSRGGETGYISANTVEDYRKSIDNAVKYGTVDMNKQAKAIKKGYMAGVKAIQDTARLMESVTRLNQFVAALREGKTIDAAITDAKNVSTNFNRRGSHEGVQWLFDNYAFLNASLQGTDRLYRGIKKYKKGFAKIIGTIISIGFLDSLLCAIFSGDDDRWGDAYHALPETKRYNNLVIPAGEGKFIFIPLAQSLRGFHAWGAMLADLMTGYHKRHPLVSDPMTPLNFLAVIGQDIVPITYGSRTNAAPTWAQPIAHIAFNENFMGRPLYKETPWNENLPEFRKAYGSTPKGLVKWSEFVNEMTGGNYAEKGWLEQIPVLEKLNNPAILQQLYIGYVPGLFRVLGQAYNAIDALVTKTKGRPTDFDLSDVPIIGAAVGEANDRIPKSKLRSKWYEFANKARDSKRADSELLKELFIDEFIENTRDSDKVLSKSVYDGLNVHIRNLMKLEGMAETWEDDLVSGDLPADEAIRTSAEIASLRNTIDNTLYDIINELKIAQ
ncbi:LPD38 domain-containing protein [Barnesiella intestinihominis]|uniref:LPD38 domain-containing protein n=1 Tax=Barnesiella intestinihominis TaxID=487174 RepID=UPI003FD89EA5